MTYEAVHSEVLSRATKRLGSFDVKRFDKAFARSVMACNRAGLKKPEVYKIVAKELAGVLGILGIQLIELLIPWIKQIVPIIVDELINWIKSLMQAGTDTASLVKELAQVAKTKI